MTPAQVETAARRRYNVESDTFYSQAEVFAIIQEGEEIMSKDSLVIEATDTSITTVASTRSYAFPTGVIAVKRVEYDGVKLQKISFREDDRLTLSNSGTTETGSPLYYSIWNDTIYLRPIPDAAKTLTLFVNKKPDDLTTSSTELSIPGRYHHYLIDYVAMHLASKDSNFEAVSFYMNRWENNLIKAEEFYRKQKRRDSFAYVKDEEDMTETLLGIT